jgi:peptide/nickel transport system substrate-binding protein
MGDMGTQAEEHLERHFIKRLTRLWNVRRFVLTWIVLLTLLFSGVILQSRSLGQYYQRLEPAAGGTYTEGILGAFTNANPLYATGSVDGSVSRLVFSSLLKYDHNNQLIGDLAESWQLDAQEVTYTVVLKPDLRWHDGRPLTSADVVFTYKTIQNPDAKSPLITSWQGITVEAKDERTITFKLPNPLSAFPHSLINGIVPKHLLDGVPSSQLRSIAFNTALPIGSGPFKWQTIEVIGDETTDREERVGLTANENYHFGKPKLQSFVIRAFRDEGKLIESFKNAEIQAAVGLEAVPDEFRNQPDIQEFSIPLTGEVLVFFRNSHEILNDAKLRRALTLAVDTKTIVRNLGYPLVLANSPLLQSHLGYDKGLAQPGFDQAEAARLLDELGWQKDPETGLRKKGNVPLSFRLYSQSTYEYAAVSQALQKQWREVGVDAQVILLSDQDLQSSVISTHNFDALLYGISLGVDPDVFVYWHSSQADPRSQNRLNFSQYRSATADSALEAGRTRSDAAIRAVKYRPFLEAWRNDVPAFALYQPRFLYLVHTPFNGLNTQNMNVGTDRYSNVHDWTIRLQKATK